jgi:TRAP transporter TAXI family solute receptor
LEIDDDHADKLIANYPFYTKFDVPGGSYKGVDSGVQTVAVVATYIVSDDLDEDLVYKMTKTLFEHAGDIATGHPKGAELDPAYSVSGISIPLHPGAEKYYQEIGVR